MNLEGIDWVQQGNPVLKHIRNVRWVFGDIVPDYLLGQTTCALYLRFSFLDHPDILWFRSYLSPFGCYRSFI